MKYIKLFTILLFSSIFFFYACNDKSKSQKKEITKPFKQVPLNTPTNSQTSQNASGVWHYICNKGCVGGSGAAGSCGTCGTTLIHNQAYHTDASKTPTNTPSNQSGIETGKNSAGVWHYICNTGCAGGAAAAGNCSTCGTKLNHNQAFHQ